MRKMLFLLFSGTLACSLFAQNNLLLSRQQWIKDIVAAQHFSPRPVDNIFSGNFFDCYLKIIDGGHLFLTAQDIKSLAPYRTTIDNDWNGGTSNFFTACSSLFKTRLTAAKARAEEICAKPFDFSLPDFYNTADTVAAATDKELYKRWYLLMKAATLQKLMGIADGQWQSKVAIDKAGILAKEPEIRARVKARYLAKIDNYLKNDADYQQQMTDAYLNTFLLCMDPHSSFFNAQARQSFENELNTEGYFFGLALADNEKGEACIAQLAPGGAAWLSGVLNKGDIPVQLRWEGSAAVDLAGLDASEISALLDLHTKEKLELTVRKGNGQTQLAVLQKQKAINEDNIVKSFVLSGKQNIGYISLPSFYTEWEDKTGSRCAADVAREIVKLKKDSINGLILDLRFNGGGSLEEAIELAGIFIDEGAICQIKGRDGKAEVYKDLNRGVIYSGPLLVLVNGQSASASELLAAALQDYNRAIIAGSDTYGKATGQSILPLQKGNNAEVAKAGFVKLTMMKLYRPTGKTAQFTGVVPDLKLPGLLNEEEKESGEAFAITPDTVSAYKYFRPLQPLPVAGLQQKSEARMAVNAKFNEARKWLTSRNGLMKTGAFSLKWDDAVKDLKAYSTQDLEELLKKPSTDYTVRKNTPDQKLFNAGQDEVLTSFWVRRLSADLYIEEAFHILNDYNQIH